MSAPAPPNTPAFGRLARFASKITEAAANQNLEGTGAGVPPPHERDLVAKLINDPENKVIWEKLLNNPLCKAMKEAGKFDQNVLRGFEWYTRQDYHYFTGLIEAESNRLSKAQNTADFEESTKSVVGLVDHTEIFFEMSTAPQPAGIGLSPESVLAPIESKALPKYIDLIVSEAEKEDKVFSDVVMIAGDLRC